MARLIDYLEAAVWLGSGNVWLWEVGHVTETGYRRQGGGSAKSEEEAASAARDFGRVWRDSRALQPTIRRFEV